MTAALFRAFLILAVAAWLTGCGGSAPGGPSSETLRTALPPAELPTYAKGDSYTLDNPRETWRVVDITNGIVTWESARGGRQATMFDPLLPPVRWRRPDGSQGVRKFLAWSGGLFPIKAGNKLTFETAVSIGESGLHARFIWNCYVGHPRQVTVPAGVFAALPVFCRRNDGRTTRAYYAPALRHAVAITVTGENGAPVARRLAGFEEGKGARIAAPKHRSLPRGWSTAYVGKRDGTGLAAGRRVAPALLAAADDAPLGFASPSGKAPPSGQPRPGQPDRSRSAERTPAGKSPKKRMQVGLGAHIGSFRSENRAQRAWTLYERRYGHILEGQSHRVARVDLGGSIGVVYRLFAGPFDTAEQGKALCRQVRKQGGYCRILTIPNGRRASGRARPRT